MANVSSASVLIDQLSEVVGPHVIVDPDRLASYTTDWTGRFVGRTAAVVRPGSTEQVAGVIDVCRRLGVALVPQGGNTGLVGGGVPLHDEIVLSLDRLRHLEPVDAVAGQVTAEAGVVISAVQDTGRRAGWTYGVDLASRGSATVGGTVATNAGGTRFLRYGDTRAQVIGVEAVLGTGSVVSHLGGLVKDNTGYDLAGLLCGSEGTLAVVTKARLRLVPALSARTVALLAFPTVSGAVDASVVLRQSLASLEACEFFLQSGLDLVAAVTGLVSPFAAPHPVYLLVEVADRTDPTADLAEVTESLDHLQDAVVATDPTPRVRAVAVPRSPHRSHQHPRSAPQDGCDPSPGIAGRLCRPGARPDPVDRSGRRHLVVRARGRRQRPCQRDRSRLPTTTGSTTPCCGWWASSAAASAPSTASARPNVGGSPCRGHQQEIDAFRSVKRALDPDGLLNPHVLLPETEGDR